MSISALTSALSGLRVAQQALDVTSNNISNAATDGYTRKTLQREALVLGDSVAGVRAGTITRNVDQYIMRDYRTQVSLQGYLDTKENYLNRIVSLHGRPEQETNIAARIGALQNIFTELSSTPESDVLQSQVVDVANNLAQSFNQMSSTLLEQRNQAQNELKESITNLNIKLEEVASLNRRIQTAINTGSSTATLQDSRDMVVKEIAKELDITYYVNGEGALIVQTSGGQVLADTEARQIQFSPAPIGYDSSYPTNVAGISLVDSQQTFDLTEMNLGGRMGALIELRDEIIPTYQAQLDELAHKMALRFEEQGLRLFTNNNNIVPIDDPSQYNGFASEIRVNSAVMQDPSLVQKGTTGLTPDSGDNTLILNIINHTFGAYQDDAGTPHADFRTDNIGPNGQYSLSAVSSGTTLEEFARSMISRISSDHAIIEERQQSEEVYTLDVEKRLLDQSGVDTDEEMAELIVLQQSYSAAAKMITALDELFEKLLNAI